jgi:glycosyltransferase involved in cell wall biosynthesis
VAACEEIDLTVWFYCDFGARGWRDPGFCQDVKWDVPLLEGYRHRFLSGAGGATTLGPVRPRRTWEVVRAVASRRFDVVWLHGYSSIDTWVVVLTCRALGIPVLLREEATLLDARTMPRRLVKAALLPALFRLVHCSYIGTQNRRFFERHGVPGHRLFFAPYSVDNAFFRRQASALMSDGRTLRTHFGLRPDGPVVLFCGKLIPKKDPVVLLRAFACVRKRLACSLLFAGDGPLRETILQMAERDRIPDVRVTGFLNQSSVSRAYAVANVLVLPSRERETWGLVVNEGMNFGLPVIVSDRVGCGCDLVVPGANGLVVPAGSVTDLADAIHGLISDPEKLRTWGERSIQLVSDFSVDRSAEGIIGGVLELARARRSTNSA